MLDDYSLCLLAEIGVDVYVPRSQVAGPAPAVASRTSANSRNDPGHGGQRAADVVVICAGDSRSRMLGDLLRSLRMSRLDATLSTNASVEAIASARALIVLGEALARSLGAELPAQRQNQISWIVSHEPDALAQSADAKRALWGEIKRLARLQARRPRDA